MMLSLCTEYYQFFLAQGVGLGLAFGLVFNLSVSSPGHWFNAKRATAFGVMASGSSTVSPDLTSSSIAAHLLTRYLFSSDAQ